MPDLMDSAQELEIKQRESALRHVRPKRAANSINECVECGKPIGERRKRAVPSATLCLSCQTQKEERRWT